MRPPPPLMPPCKAWMLLKYADNKHTDANGSKTRIFSNLQVLFV